MTPPSLAAETACKAQQQRDEAISDLELARKTIETLSDEVESLKQAAARRAEPVAPRSPPAKGGLPNEPGDSDDSVRAKQERTKDGDRSSSESEGDNSGGNTGSSSADSATDRKRRPTVDELAKNDPDLARELQLVGQADAIKYMIAHGRMPDAEASLVESGGADDPAGALVRSDARSLQLGERQAARLDRRLQQHQEAAAFPRRSRDPASTAASSTPVGSVSGAQWSAGEVEPREIRHSGAGGESPWVV